MKIKLISPKMSLRATDSEYKRVLSPPLALLTLSALTPKEHKVSIFDENTAKLKFKDKPDLVGITVNVDTSKRAYEISEKYRELGVPVILGGIHVSANPEEALDYCDAVCIGEAEEIWEIILEDAFRGELKKVYENPLDTDLSKIPLISRKAVNQNNYLYTNITYTSRNCPFNCKFCYNSCAYTKKYRNRPISKIISEISDMGTRHVMFVDDNFIGNRKWVKKFLNEIKPLKLKWSTAVSADIANDPELLDLMKETGCQSLFIGFETINQDSLNTMKKDQNSIEKYEKTVREIHNRGIMINASIVFGFDNDGPEVFDETLEWLCKNKIETLTGHILTPYPGTKLFKEYHDAGRIDIFDWSKYNTSNVVFKPKKLTKEQLFNGYVNIYKKFYSLKNIIRRIPDDKGQWVSFFLFNFFYRKFGFVISKFARFGFMNFLGRVARRLSYGIG